MNQLATAMALSQSATTRLVTRLEDRGLLARYLCPTDRRGIYSEVTEPGFALLDRARPAHNSTLQDALAEAANTPGDGPPGRRDQHDQTYCPLSRVSQLVG